MRLETFAFHIQQICLEPVGSQFTLHAGFDTRVRVWIVSDEFIRFDGRWVGNRQGAAQKYAEIVGSEIVTPTQTV